jgi:hypothetical protein
VAKEALSKGAMSVRDNMTSQPFISDLTSPPLDTSGPRLWQDEAASCASGAHAPSTMLTRDNLGVAWRCCLTTRSAF